MHDFQEEMLLNWSRGDIDGTYSIRTREEYRPGACDTSDSDVKGCPL